MPSGMTHTGAGERSSLPTVPLLTGVANGERMRAHSFYLPGMAGDEQAFRRRRAALFVLHARTSRTFLPIPRNWLPTYPHRATPTCWRHAALDRAPPTPT